MAAERDRRDHERNRGKGAAIRTALDQAPGDYTAILDADLEYSPRTSRRCSRLLAGDAQVVLGPGRLPAIRRSASGTSWATGRHLRDERPLQQLGLGHDDLSQSHVHRALPLARAPGGGFAIEPEITARVLL